MAAGSAGGSVGGTVGGGGVTGGGITGGGVTGGGVTGGPAKTTRPILLLLGSLDQRVPSGPSGMPNGALAGGGAAEAGVMAAGGGRPALLPADPSKQGGAGWPAGSAAG